LTKPKIYIAYTNRDGIGFQYADILKKELEKHAFPDVFLFPHSKDNSLGSYLWDFLTAEIIKHDMMVVICTPSVENSGARREYNIALMHFKRVVPLQYDDTKIPETIAVDLGDRFDKDNYQTKFNNLVNTHLPESYAKYLEEKREAQQVSNSVSTSKIEFRTLTSVPKTTELMLSEARKAKFRDEAIQTFRRSCLSRIILKPSKPKSESGFRTIDFNYINGRVWFVEPPSGSFDGHVFATLSGATYGSAIAEEELRQTLENILSIARKKTEHVLEVSSAQKEDDIVASLDLLHRRGFQSRVIVTNIKQGLTFWEFKAFIGTKDRRFSTAFQEGDFKGLPVFYSRLLPDGLTLAIDSEKLGLLEIENDFDIMVTDLLNSPKREAIRSQLSDLSEADLNERVQIQGSERVKATVFEDKPYSAFVILASKGTSLALKKFN